MSLPVLPAQPPGTPYPTDGWPRAEPPAALTSALQPFLETAFEHGVEGELGETHALLIVREGKLIIERYGCGYGPADTRPSWSMAKSMTHALAGMMVADTGFDIHAPLRAPEWSAADDPRSAITLDHLMRMSSGLTFIEEYQAGHPSHVLEMLYGAGKADTAAYAASLPLLHAPGTVWSYASGTTNIISRRISEHVGGGREACGRFMTDRLFAPLGMTSAVPKFDAAGVFIGSSYCFCTPQDFARFGLLYLRGGLWDGRRLLPASWVDYARTPTPQPPEAALGYGAHWWLSLGGPGSFSANGFEGQFIVCLPESDTLIVRSGRTPLANREALASWMKALSGTLTTV